MKNEKNENSKQKKNIKNNHGIIKSQNILLLFFIFINYFLKKIVCYNNFQMYGTGRCKVKTKGIKVKLSSQTSFYDSDPTIECYLNSVVTQLEFQSSLSDFSFMFENCITLKV